MSEATGGQPFGLWRERYFDPSTGSEHRSLYTTQSNADADGGSPNHPKEDGVSTTFHKILSNFVI
ncbi:MAG: hypothetical protein KME23_23375 [Goleter apudmare HA4340-LM2]|nr:hypothetical protein [Goleter apudmare HA4340-LM2]